jgi:nicotinate-nucleotide adenylyltransferase
LTAPPRHSRPGFREPARERRIALFGGTFDPIHNGHLAVARAAERRFGLDEIHFIPAGIPPHKRRSGIATYPDRYAMVALACAGHPRFVASLAESGRDHSGREVFYSVDTVRRFRQKFARGRARLFFLLGADSFLDLRTWRDYRTLLGLCNFIVASRPGFPVNALRAVIPENLLAMPGPQGSRSDCRVIALRWTKVHVLEAVRSRVSATEVRKRMDRKRSIRGLVPLRVEEYITKQALYQ